MTAGKMRAMPDDRSWIGLDYWERVRWARLYWQRRTGAIAETARFAAETLGMKENTYSAYERRPNSSKHTKLDHQAAIRFARKFGVRWEWLLTGAGTPYPGDPLLEEIERARLEPDFDKKADAIITLLRSGRR